MSYLRTVHDGIYTITATGTNYNLSDSRSLTINGTSITLDDSRGHTLSVLNKDTLELVGNFNYDTWRTSNSTELVNKLNTLTDEIIVLTSSDAITNDSALQTTLHSFGLPSTLAITVTKTQMSFVFIGQKGLSDGEGAVCDFSTSAKVTCTAFAGNGTLQLEHRNSLEPQNDTTSSLFRPIKTAVVSAQNTLHMGTINYVNGTKYHITVKFRTRGDGNSTSSKCSSVGFIASNSDWSNAYKYMHDSATAYDERGQIVEWTYNFTANTTESTSNTLYFIIDKNWANGFDNQTIDLFYYKLWDENGNVYAEDGNPNESIVKYWSDGTTPITTEKTLINATESSKGLYSETINYNYITVGEKYRLTFQAKKTSNCKGVAVYVSSSDHPTTGFITSFTPSVSTEYYQYSHEFTLTKKDESSLLPKLGITFANKGSSDTTDSTLYVKNVTLKKLEEYPRNFMKTSKDEVEYFTHTFNTPKDIQISEGVISNYLAQSTHEYKCSELTSFTYDVLDNKFEY